MSPARESRCLSKLWAHPHCCLVFSVPQKTRVSKHHRCLETGKIEPCFSRCCQKSWGTIYAVQFHLSSRRSWEIEFITHLPLIQRGTVANNCTLIQTVCFSNCCLALCFPWEPSEFQVLPALRDSWVRSQSLR